MSPWVIRLAYVAHRWLSSTMSSVAGFTGSVPLVRSDRAGAAVEVLEDARSPDGVGPVDQAELVAGGIAHDHPAARVVLPLVVDERRAEADETPDLGIEVVGVDVEVDPRRPRL